MTPGALGQWRTCQVLTKCRPPEYSDTPATNRNKLPKARGIRLDRLRLRFLIVSLQGTLALRFRRPFVGAAAGTDLSASPRSRSCAAVQANPGERSAAERGETQDFASPRADPE